jgi:hypothetical protein
MQWMAVDDDFQQDLWQASISLVQTLNECVRKLPCPLVAIQQLKKDRKRNETEQNKETTLVDFR